jgi:hypothetical protein
VKANNLTRGLFAALLLASPLALAETQYPAANFEPVIITQDADLIAKHGQAAKVRAAAEQAKAGASSGPTATPTVSTQQAKADSAESKPEPSITKKEESSMELFPIVLVVLALGGLVFWNSKKSKPAEQEITAAPAPAFQASAGETGVARYLKSLPETVKVAETGVAKYLKSLPPKVEAAPAPAETGVAKYLKSLPPKAVSGETGVAKYLKGLNA